MKSDSARILTIWNNKGGCGKTTTAINLSAHMASLGQRVLLIDLDPQGHASLGVGIDIKSLDTTMYDVLTEEKMDTCPIDKIIQPLTEGLDLAPSDRLLSALEQEMAGQPGRTNRLTKNLKDVRDQYDYIIIDCAPSIGLLTFGAIFAAQEVIVPIEVNCFFSRSSYIQVLEVIDMLEQSIGKKIVLHVLATIYDRRFRNAGAILTDLFSVAGEKMFNTVIRVNSKLGEAARKGLPITRYDTRCRGYEDYLALAAEIIDLHQS